MRPAQLLALFSLCAMPAAAQVMEPSTSPFAGSEGVEESPPVTSYPLGDSEAVAHNMLVAMRMEQHKRDLCWKLGCLVIVNESNNYQVSGFYVQTSVRDGSPTWSRNQFGAPLMPRRATFRFKTGDSSACDRAVLFVMKHPRTKDVFRFETRVSLCSSPQRDSLVRIRAVIPEVTVGGA